MNAPNLVSVVLPVYNQADFIAGTVEGYRGTLDRLGVARELLLVTNGCTDDSVAVCRALEADHEDVRVIELDEGGWGVAVATGLQEATGDLLAYTNSARTTPEILALLVLYATVYPEVVLKANRRIRDNWRRRLGSVIYNLECRALFDLSTWDINGTPKVFPRKFSKLMELKRRDDLIDAELMATCAREGYPIVEVPVLATVRHGGRSTTNYGSALRMYLGAWQLARAGLGRERA